MRIANLKIISAVFFNASTWVVYIISMLIAVHFISITLATILQQLYEICIAAINALSSVFNLNVELKLVYDLVNVTSSYTSKLVEVNYLLDVGVIAGLMSVLPLMMFYCIFTFRTFDSFLLKAATSAGVSKYEYSAELTEFCNKANHKTKLKGVYISNDTFVNAFAISKNNSGGAIILTSGLLSVASKEEIAFIIGHEIGHLENGDGVANIFVLSAYEAFNTFKKLCFQIGNLLKAISRISVILYPLYVMVTVYVYVLFLGTKLAEWSFRLLDAFFSRAMEFAADRRGVELSSKHAALSMLNKFVNEPFSFVPNLVATHPKSKRRIKRLK